MSSYSEIPTDIATPPAAVSSTADETDDLGRGVPMLEDQSMPSPPPTASAPSDFADLSRQVDFLSGKLDHFANSMEGSVLSFFTLVKELDTKFEKRFDIVDRRFDEVDRRFDEVDRRFDEVDHRLDEVDRRFGRVDTVLGHLYERVCSVEGKVDCLDGKFSSLESRFDLLETGVGERFDTSDLSRDAWLARIETEVVGVKQAVENVSDDLSSLRSGLGRL